MRLETKMSVNKTWAKVFAMSMATIVAITVLPYSPKVEATASVPRSSYISSLPTAAIAVAAPEQFVPTVTISSGDSCINRESPGFNFAQTVVQDAGRIDLNGSADCFQLQVAVAPETVSHLTVQEFDSYATVSVIRQTGISSDYIANSSSTSGYRALPVQSSGVDNEGEADDGTDTKVYALFAAPQHFMAVTATNQFQVLRC